MPGCGPELCADGDGDGSPDGSPLPVPGVSTRSHGYPCALPPSRLHELLGLYLRSTESYTELIFSTGAGDFAIEATVGMNWNHHNIIISNFGLNERRARQREHASLPSASLSHAPYTSSSFPHDIQPCARERPD